MGYGEYSLSSRETRSKVMGYDTKSVSEIFSGSLDPEMNPHGVKLRESRDSEEHPESVAIVLGLDVTGSMHSIPHFLVKEGLPNIMQTIMDEGVADPQILFLGIGDHECDRAPLQVGQFESSDELLDKWLTSTWIEGGGGGNIGESYHLAWYFASLTSIDCFEKRNKKGFLFTIGDEPVLKDIGSRDLKRIMGDGQYDRYQSTSLLSNARTFYNVYHLHVMEGSNGRDQSVIAGWKQLMGNNLILVRKKEDVAKIISKVITENYIHEREFIAEDEFNIDL